MKKGIGDLKRCLEEHLRPQWRTCPNLRAQLDAVIHDLKQRPKRSLRGRAPCDAFHDQNHPLRLSKKDGAKIFRPNFPLALPDVLADNQEYAEPKPPPYRRRLAPNGGILAGLPGTDLDPAQQKQKSGSQFSK